MQVERCQVPVCGWGGEVWMGGRGVGLGMVGWSEDIAAVIALPCGAFCV